MSRPAPLAHALPLRDGRIHISLWALLTSAAWAQASVTTGLLGGTLSALFWGVLLAGALLLGHRHAQAPQPLAKQLSDASAVIGLMAFLAALFAAGITAALALLLLWLQVAKACTLATKRDLHFSVAISFVLLVFAASQSRSGGFLVFIALYVLSGVYTLVLAYAEECRATAAGVAEGERGFPASALPLSLALLSVALALYLFMPRPPAALLGSYQNANGTSYFDERWGREAESEARKQAAGDDGDEDGDGPTQGTRRARTPKDFLDPRTRRQSATPQDENGANESGRNERGTGPNEPAERTQGAGSRPRNAPETPPAAARWLEEELDIGRPDEGGGKANVIVLYVQAPHSLHLRARVLDTFDGLRWSSSATREHKRALRGGALRLKQPDGTPEVRQVIEVAAPLSDTLVGAQEIRGVDFPGNVLAENRYGVLRAPHRLEVGTRYAAYSHFERVAGHPAYPADLADPKPFLQLPDNLDPRIAALAAQVTAGRDGLDAALAIEHHLRSDYRYSWSSAATSQGVTPLVPFLFETRAGHCEYFASAMAVMLRTLGIPARVLTGFSANKYNPLTGFYEVWALDGHAWVEAWFPQHGWVQFEPTSAYPLPGDAPPPTAAQAVEDYLQGLSRMERDLDPGHRAELSWAERLSTMVTALRTGATVTALAVYRFVAENGVALVATVAAGVLLLFGWRRVQGPLADRLALRRLGRLRGDPQRLALACFLELERWQARRGAPRAPGDTVEEYLDALAGRLPQREREVREIAALFTRVRYGEERPSTEEAQAAHAAFISTAAAAPPASAERK